VHTRLRIDLRDEETGHAQGLQASPPHSAAIMAPSAMLTLPPASALQENINAPKASLEASPHPAYLHNLALSIAHNLQYHHDWTSLSVHTHSSLTNSPLPRPVISGLPPKRAYIHPDEQVEILKVEHSTGKAIPQVPESEWVLPTHLQERWSLAKFAAVFDALDTVPPAGKETLAEEGAEVVGHQWQGRNRQKRLLLATLHDDSTVVYYIIHDGIVKPRQN
jgi:tRNA-splicing endonuclease subunit Sen15